MRNLLFVSAIGFAAMLYGEDFNDIVEITKADAIVTNAKTKFRRIDILESLHIAFAGEDRAGQSMEDA
ncbi:MAG: hypothetical protein WBX38_15710 [Candidatus Sulfotelmatobacter sp.]